MRIDENIANILFEKLSRQRKVTNITYTMEHIVNLGYTINEINALDKDMEIFNGYSLSKYRIPTEFEPLIIPSKVRFNDNTWSIDVRSDKYKTNALSSVKGAKVLSPDEWEAAWSAIYSSFKRASDVAWSEDLVALRKPTALGSVDSRLKPHDTDCVLSEINGLPIEISINVYEKFMYNMPYLETVKEYFYNLSVAVANNKSGASKKNEEPTTK